MSQFIELPQTMPMQAPAILKGILSKVFSAPPQSASRSKQQKLLLKSDGFKTFYQDKTYKRFAQQMQLADQLKNVVMNKQYEGMKQKLVKYGRSTSMKIGNIMTDKKKKRQYFGDDQNQWQGKQSNKNIGRRSKMSQHNDSNSRKSGIDLITLLKKEQKQAKHRYSIGNIYSTLQKDNNRVVYVDRKYNKEFSIRLSNLIEAQKIQQSKQNYINFLKNYKHSNPLVEQTNVEIYKRRKYQSEYEKEPIETIGIVRLHKRKNDYEAFKTQKGFENNFQKDFSNNRSRSKDNEQSDIRHQIQNQQFNLNRLAQQFSKMGKQNCEKSKTTKLHKRKSSFRLTFNKDSNINA